MKLFEIAFTSHVYDSFTNFHTDFVKLCEDTKPSLDMNNPKHRQELINWLNQWGCRQFALDYHSLASQEMLDWFEGNSARLVPKDKPLWALTESDLRRKGLPMSLNKTRGFLYKLAKFLGDWQALSSGNGKKAAKKGRAEDGGEGSGESASEVVYVKVIDFFITHGGSFKT